MDTLEQLNKWFLSQCNGTWEHQSGITIESTDNPGWWVKICLKGTHLETQTFQKVARGVGPDGHPNNKNWIHCSVEKGQFDGAGDPARLQEILGVFLNWANGKAS
jgi:hypothetical protein